VNRSSRPNISEKLSQYLDGELDEYGVAEVEQLLREDPSAAAELEELRRLRDLLGERHTLSRQPAFWSMLQQELSRRKSEQENLLPFPKRFVPVGIATAIVAVVAVGVLVFQQRIPILQYLAKQSEVVQKSFQNDILKGTVLPMFQELDKDNVLQFAMFGTLPLDENSDRALRVDEDSESGYQIEMGETVSRERQQVTFEDLIAEVRPTAKETRAIDSLLENAKVRIAWSAFVGENNAIAIDPELTRLNRSMLVAIAQNLEPQRRARFDRFLEERKARYSVAGLVSSHPDAPPPPKTGLALSPPEPAQRNFVVITPDTFVLSPVVVNVGELQEMQRREMGRVSELHLRLESTIREIGRKRVRPVTREKGHVSVYGVERGAGYVRINVQPQIHPRPEDSVLSWATPRNRPSVYFRFEQQVRTEGGRVTTTIIQQDLDQIMKDELNKAYEMQRKTRMLDPNIELADSFEMKFEHGFGDTVGIRSSRASERDSAATRVTPRRRQYKY